MAHFLPYRPGEIAVLIATPSKHPFAASARAFNWKRKRNLAIFLSLTEGLLFRLASLRGEISSPLCSPLADTLFCLFL